MPAPVPSGQHGRRVTAADTTRTDSRLVRASLPAQIFGRFTSNLAFRVVFPYTRTIADDLGTSLGTVGALLSARELAGLSALPLGHAIDGGRHRRWMVLALAVLALGSLGVAGAPDVWWVGVALIVMGVAKPAYDTAMGAWIGDHVPFAQRGRITGITELSWAGAFLVGLPLLAPLVDRFSWRAPFVVLGAAQAIAGLWLLARLPRDRPHPPRPWRWHLRLRPHTVWLFPAVVSLVAGHQLVLVSFGAWLEDDYGLDAGGLGLVAMVVGLAELAGTIATVVLADRIGKRVSFLAGGIIMLVALLCFPVADSTAASVAAVAVALGGFELAFISSLPLTTEIDPESRGTALGLMAALWTLARAVFAVVGTLVYDHVGAGAIGLAAAVAAFTALVLMAGPFREPT